MATGSVGFGANENAGFGASAGAFSSEVALAGAKEKVGFLSPSVADAVAPVVGLAVVELRAAFGANEKPVEEPPPGDGVVVPPNPSPVADGDLTGAAAPKPKPVDLLPPANAPNPPEADGFGNAVEAEPDEGPNENAGLLGVA